jgi:hypothetical protein
MSMTTNVYEEPDSLPESRPATPTEAEKHSAVRSMTNETGYVCLTSTFEALEGKVQGSMTGNSQVESDLIVEQVIKNRAKEKRKVKSAQGISAASTSADLTAKSGRDLDPTFPASKVEEGRVTKTSTNQGKRPSSSTSRSLQNALKGAGDHSDRK